MLKIPSSIIQQRTVLIILIIGFLSITSLAYYSILQIKYLSKKNTEAIHVLKAWSSLKGSIQQTLTSPDLDGAQYTLALSIDTFDIQFSAFIESNLIKQLADDNLKFRNMIKDSDSLWQSLYPRLENLQLRLRMYSLEYDTQSTEIPRSLLLDLGSKLGRHGLSNEHLALHELTDDISFIVSVSHERFSVLFSETVNRLSADIDNRIFMVFSISILLSLIIVALIVVYIFRVQRELILSEQRYRSLHENIPVGIFRTDTNGKIISANQALAAIYGYPSLKKLIGSIASDFIIHQEDWTRYKDRILKNKSIKNLELQMTNKDGRKQWISISSRAIDDDNGEVEYFDGIVLDITQRKQYQEQLLETKNQLEQVLKLSPAVIYRCGPGPDYPTEYISDNLKSKYGFAPSDFYNDKFFWTKLIHSDDKEKALNLLNSISSGESAGRQYRLRHRDGNYIWIYDIMNPLLDENNRVIGIIGSWLDISEQKQVEEELRQSEATLQSLLMAAPVGIGLTHNRKLNWVSDYLTGMVGYLKNELVGKSAMIFYPDKEEYDRVGREKYNQLNKYGIGWIDTVWQKKDGTKIDVHLRSTALNPEDLSAGVIFTALDITETKRLQEVASRAQRLETAGRIAGQVAHDFNNLLGPLVAYPSFIRDELPPDHPALEYINDMEQAADQIANINQQLLTLGRRGHYNQGQVQFNNLIEQTIAQIEPLPEAITIQTELSSNLLPIQGGAAQLSRIIINLITNSIDSIEGIGRVHISTANHYIDKQSSKNHSIPTGEYIKLTLTDTGCGINSEVLPRIFDPFFTTKKADRKRGSGLGLSVVHSVIEDHNGYIDVESNPGEGTSVKIYFPVNREKQSAKPDIDIQGGSESVLVIDDDKIQRDVISKILIQWGYKVNTAPSGEEALEYLKTDKPDLLILDMIMPNGIDGAETFIRARKVYPGIKAIVVSGYSESDRVQLALANGAGAYIRKPLTHQSLAEAVRREIDRK
ncbi:MAG: PAS domain S-box protein [candidate division Zixibacteria bacterium]|nr:PAS domain S-box protein [candidate division Zixibacteria bacterium]